MIYASEDLILKKYDISPDYIHLSHIMGNLCIDETIKNYIKGDLSHNQENNFEESISNNVVDSIFNIRFKSFEFKLNSNEEKKEDFKHYFHSSTRNEINHNLPLKIESQN